MSIADDELKGKGEPEPEKAESPTRELDVIVMDTVGCARCHSDGHEQLSFEKFVNSSRIGEQMDVTHWAMCPETNQPIFLAFTSL